MHIPSKREPVGKIDCTTCSSPGHPGGSDFSLIGDCGWPRVPRDSLSLSGQGRAEQWPVCPLIGDFFSAPGHMSGTSQVSQTERQSSWPGIARHFPASAEQSSGLFATWSVRFLVRQVTWARHPRFPRLKDNQVGPLTLQQLGINCMYTTCKSDWLLQSILLSPTQSLYEKR